MGNNKLLHSGIKGMRWGIRRWQNKDGSLTPAGRERYRDDESEEERKQREEADKKYREEAKNRAMRSGDADKVERWKYEMTNKELEDAIKRIDLDKQLRDSGPYAKSGFDRAMSAADKLDKIQKAGGTLVNAYNLVAKINNTFNKKFQLPGINDDIIKTVDKYAETAKRDMDAAKVREAIAKAAEQESKTRVQEHNEQQLKKKAAEKEKNKS